MGNANKRPIPPPPPPPATTATPALNKQLIDAILDADVDSVRKFLDMGANPNVSSLFGSALETAIGMLSSNIKKRRRGLAIVNLLLDRGVNVNVIGPSGWTPLYAAVAYTYGNLVKLLLQRGADKTIKNKNGSSVFDAAKDIPGMTGILTGPPQKPAPDSTEFSDVNEQLYDAVEKGDIDKLVDALNRGANPNTRDDGHPAIKAAAMYESYDGKRAIDMVNILLDKGARVNAVDTGFHGGTALSEAVVNGNKDLVALLLQRGANKEIRNKYGKSLSQLAKDPEIKDLLGPSDTFGSEAIEDPLKPRDTFRYGTISIGKKAGITTPIIKDRSVEYKISVSTDTTKHDTKLYQDIALDFDWFKKQHDFLASLTEAERTLLRSYTRNGDEVISRLYRPSTYTKKDERYVVKERTYFSPPETLTKDLLKIVETLKTPFDDGTPRPNIFDPVPLDSINERNVLKQSRIYSQKLFKIFEKAPPVEKPLRVARGIRLDDPATKVTPFSGVTSTTYALIGYTLSKFSSIYPDRAKKPVFGDLIPDMCCAFDMILQPGVRAIWLEPITYWRNEDEIALLPSMVQVSLSHPKLKTYYRTLHSDDETYQMLTYDAIVRPITGKTFSMKGGKTRKHKSKRQKTVRKRQIVLT